MLILERYKQTTKPEKDRSMLKLTNVGVQRMASVYFKQLSDFIIPVAQLQLIETIGQGNAQHARITVGLVSFSQS